MHRFLIGLSLFVSLAACAGGADQPIDSTTPTSSTTPPTAIPDDAGPVFVDTSDILLMESFPVQVALHLTGNLPTPCHQAVWEVEDDGTTIAVRLASVTEPDVVCAQVLEPFEVSIPLGDFESGTRVVTLNGAEIGDFEV